MSSLRNFFSRRSARVVYEYRGNQILEHLPILGEALRYSNYLKKFHHLLFLEEIQAQVEGEKWGGRRSFVCWRLNLDLFGPIKTMFHEKERSTNRFISARTRNKNKTKE